MPQRNAYRCGNPSASDTRDHAHRISQFVNGEQRFSGRAEEMLADCLANVPATRRIAARRLLRATAAGDVIGALLPSPRGARLGQRAQPAGAGERSRAGNAFSRSDRCVVHNL